MSTVKRRFPVVLLILLAVAAVLFFLWQQQAEERSDRLLLYGNVDIREVQLAFRQPGRLQTLNFDEGDRVAKGTLLAELDAQPYREALAVASANTLLARTELNKLQAGLRPQEVEQARAVLNQAQAVARDARANHQRQQVLVKDGAVSRSMADAAQAAHEQAQARVHSAQAALSQAMEGFRQEDIAAAEARLAAAEATEAQAETALADTRLLAPTDGVILSRVREAGSMLVSQAAVYTLSLEHPVYVRAYVGEPDLGQAVPGRRVLIHSDSSERVYQGQIGFVSPRAEFTPKTVETTDLRTELVYRLRIVVSDADDALRQGMPVTVELQRTGADE